MVFLTVLSHGIFLPTQSHTTCYTLCIQLYPLPLNLRQNWLWKRKITWFRVTMETPLHLSSMVPRINKAINALAANKPVILWAMYNQNICGKWLWPENNRNKNFQVRHIPFKIENYAKYMSHVDIGIVPQLMPTRNSILLKYLLGTVKRHFNENTSDFLLRFIETTNIGRILVFAQYGIPVISHDPIGVRATRHRRAGDRGLPFTGMEASTG